MKTSFKYELTLFDAVDDEYVKTLRVDVDYVKRVDPWYGAEADGNRGVRAVFTEDVIFKIFDEKGNNVTLTVLLEWPIDYQKIEEKAKQAAIDAAEGDD